MDKLPLEIYLKQANKARYLAIKRALRLRELNYRKLGELIGYSETTVKQYMHALKSGRRGSRFLCERIDEVLGGIQT